MSNKSKKNNLSIGNPVNVWITWDILQENKEPYPPFNFAKAFSNNKSQISLLTGLEKRNKLEPLIIGK